MDALAEIIRTVEGIEPSRHDRRVVYANLYKEPINPKNKKRGQPRADMYLAKVFTWQYDLEEMLIANGIVAVTEELMRLHCDLKNGKRYKNRHKNAKKIKTRVNGGLEIANDLEAEAA